MQEWRLLQIGTALITTASCGLSQWTPGNPTTMSGLISPKANYHQSLRSSGNTTKGPQMVWFNLNPSLIHTRLCDSSIYVGSMPPIWSIMSQLLPSEIDIKSSALNPEAPPYIPKAQQLMSKTGKQLLNPNFSMQHESTNMETSNQLSYAEVVKKLAPSHFPPVPYSPKFSKKKSVELHALKIESPYDEWSEWHPKCASQQKFEKSKATKLKYSSFNKNTVKFDPNHRAELAGANCMSIVSCTLPGITQLCTSYPESVENLHMCNSSLLSFFIGNELPQDSYLDNNTSSDEDDDLACDSVLDSSMDLQRINDAWNKVYCDSPTNCDISSKVKFDDQNLETVHKMIHWDFAYRKARVGKWEELARDRCRFQNRIKSVGEKINWVLGPDHRKIIYDQQCCGKLKKDLTI